MPPAASRSPAARAPSRPAARGLALGLLGLASACGGGATTPSRQTRPGAAAAHPAGDPTAGAANAPSGAATSTPAPPPSGAGGPAPSPATWSLESCLSRARGPFAPLDRTLCAEAHRRGVPGASLALIAPGQSPHLFTVGVRCRGRPAPMTPDTRLRLGSVTKVLTGLVAAELARDGALDLDAPATRWLPEVTFAPPPAPSLAALLRHEAGLVDRPPRPEDPPLDLSALSPFRRRLGGRARYASTDVALAGWALVRAAGVPEYRALLREHLPAAALAPSLAVADGTLPPGTSCGHLPGGPPLDVAEDFSRYAHGARWTAPAGAAVATAGDLARLLTGQDPAIWQQVARDPAPAATGDPFGLGVRVGTAPDGALRLHHTGDTGTFWAAASWLPERRAAVVILVNTSSPLRATLEAARAHLR